MYSKTTTNIQILTVIRVLKKWEEVFFIRKTCNVLAHLGENTDYRQALHVEVMVARLPKGRD